MDGVAPGCRIPGGRDRARLHVNAGDPLNPARQMHAMRRARKGGLRSCRIPQVRFDRAIAGDVVPQLRCPFAQRVDGVGDRGKRLPVDQHGLRGIACLPEGLGYHHRDGLADEARAVGGQRPLARDETLGSVAIGHRNIGPGLRTAGGMGEVSQAIGEHVRAGQHRQHTRQCGRSRNVDRPDRGVSVRRPDHHGAHSAGKIQVVGIPPLPGDEAVILPTADGRPVMRIRHPELHPPEPASS